MFKRLLILLIVALAMPTAVAAPACASEPTEARAAHGDAHQPQPKKQQRGKPGEPKCLGCVAPSTLNPPMIEAPVPALLLIPASFVVTDTAFDRTPPTLRPPRHG